jgi:hypothetical protein
MPRDRSDSDSVAQRLAAVLPQQRHPKPKNRKTKPDTRKPDESSTDASEEAPRSKSQIGIKSQKPGLDGEGSFRKVPPDIFG